MVSGVLVIGEKEQASIVKALEAAKVNTTPWDVLKNIATDTGTGTLNLDERRNPARIAEVRRKYAAQRVDLGTYSCAISFEEQPAGIFRHLSVSSRKRGKVPNALVMSMVAEAFGFSSFPPLRPYRVWTEEYEPGRHAVNVVEQEAS